MMTDLMGKEMRIELWLLRKELNWDRSELRESFCTMGKCVTVNLIVIYFKSKLSRLLKLPSKWFTQRAYVPFKAKEIFIDIYVLVLFCLAEN